LAKGHGGNGFHGARTQHYYWNPKQNKKTTLMNKKMKEAHDTKKELTIVTLGNTAAAVSPSAGSSSFSLASS
jgi:heterodisulfide reductase subunit A-like polyferredoxin